MTRPKRAKKHAETGYPTLAEFICERRDFLRKLAAGAASLGLAGGVLAACELEGGRPRDVDLDEDEGAGGAGGSAGDGTGFRGDSGTGGANTDDGTGGYGTGGGGMPEPDYFDVRLPAEGHESTYNYDGMYVTYAVTFLTWNEAFAEHFWRQPRGIMQEISEIVGDYDCVALSPHRAPQDPAVAQAIAEMLLGHFARETGRGGGHIESLIESLVVDVTACEYEELGGVAPDPDYP